MNLFHFSMTQFQVFLLVFSRVGAMIFAMPVIGARTVPRQFRVGLAVVISLMLLPLSPVEPRVLSADLAGLTAGLLGEVMVGVLIGFTARLLFAAAEMAGELIGFQMGFSMVNVVDPARGVPTPILGQFYGLLAMLIFLSINAHHVFLQAIGGSFALIPPFRFGMSQPLGTLLITLTGEMFVLAVKIGAPVVVAVFITNIALNIVSRTVPQMNILVVGFPVTLAVGFLLMGMSLGLTGHLLAGVFSGAEGRLAEMMGLMGR